MPLTVNLRHLEKKALRLEGELPVAELDLGELDELIRACAPLRYDLTCESMEHAVLARGRLELPLVCDCVRCLKTFEHQVVLKDWAAHLPLVGEDRVEVRNDAVDLTPLVREDILLAFPQHPLCDIACRGLPQAPPKSLPDRGPVQANEEGVSVWAELNKLKLKQ